MKLKTPEFPLEIRREIESLMQNMKLSDLMQEAAGLSFRYRNESGCGKRLLTKEHEALAYAAVRMPATFGAVAKALDYALEAVDFVPKTVLDVGAGTGAASWAAESLINLDNIVCLEREDAMRRFGEALMRKSDIPVLENAVWRSADLTEGMLAEKADLVLASYVLNEMSVSQQADVARKLWDAADKMLLLVEPGTPTGYQNLLTVRKQLIGLGAFVAAPCPHDEGCPLAAEDWCHFPCRVARSRLHRQLKKAEMGHEDEKFIYMAFVREKPLFRRARIIRPVCRNKATAAFVVCAKDGIEWREIHKNEARYQACRKDEWGDNPA